MPFKSGKSGNPSGRPKGAANKVTNIVKESITGLLEGITIEELKDDFKKLTPKERIEAYSKLSEFVAPKLSRTEMQHEFEDDGITFKLPDGNRSK